MRALVVLAELWVASEVILLAGPLRWDALAYAITAAFLLGACALTFLVAYPRRGEHDEPVTRRLLPLQLAVVLAVAAATGWTVAVHSHAIAFAPPVWTSLDVRLSALFGAVSPAGLGTAFTAFAECALLPLALLALLRVPLRAMGLGAPTKGSAVAAAIWLTAPLLAVVYLVLSSTTPVVGIARRLIFGFLATAFPEEFLFRGALYGRLRSILPAQWAAFAQAIAFGLWRLGGDVAHSHNVVTALALIVPLQGAFGYAMALLVRRTGNLAIPVIFHTLVDTIRSAV